MNKFIKKIILWTYIKIHSLFINIGIVLYNSEVNLFSIDPDDKNEKNKKITRKLHRNKLLEKFYVGQRDEKYVKDYYELLNKADDFIKNKTLHQKAVASDRWGMDMHRKDQYGRRIDHVGFFDEKHKNYGKTLKEVFELEMKERRVNDDDYELLYIFNNKPMEIGFTKIGDVVEDKGDGKLTSIDVRKKLKMLDFPLRIVREEGYDPINKIEQLTEFLHIKKIGLDYNLLEFLIPLKFKVHSVEENSDIFKELTTFKEVHFKNMYGELVAFSNPKYSKRINFKEYHVLKFEAKEMQVIQ